MKFSIIRSKFLDSLKNVQNIVAGKASLQILQNVRIEAGEGRIILTTTDLSITVKASAECDIAEPGATTLPVRLLFLTVSKMSEGIVTVEVDASDRAVVSGGSAVFKISGLPERDFPKIEQEDDSFAYTIPQPVLREMLRKTHYAASTDETRRNLQGVLFSFKEGKLTMVATDGRRLALVENEIEIPAGGERDVILSTRSIVELLRILGSGEGGVTMYLRKTQVHFDFGEIAFSSKLVAENYPDYRQVIPGACAESASVDRQLLIDAIDRASVMFLEQKNSTHFVFGENQLIISSTSADIGEARDIVPIKYAGPKIETSFNPQFIIEPLKAIDDNEVTIDMNDGISPFVIKCPERFLYVLMPLRQI